jgi:CheY-like chemotaxis protein
MGKFFICPWCSYALLPHFSNGKQQLYCQHCHQEVPVSLANSVIKTPESKCKNQSSTPGVAAGQLARQLTEVRELASVSQSGFQAISQNISQDGLIQRLSEQTAYLTEGGQIYPEAEEMILLSYVAHFLSRGKVVFSNIHGRLPYRGRIYKRVGYDPLFLEFWLQLHRRKDFAQLYLEGDIYSFGQFFNGSFEVGECVRCNIQIPIPWGMHHYGGGCHLCDKQPTYKMLNLLAVGTVPANHSLLQKLFALRGFKVTFLAHPLQVTAEILAAGIDLILLCDEVEEKMGQFWLELLYIHEELVDVPIAALSHQAGVGNWAEESPLEISLERDIGGESLAASLHYLAYQRDQVRSTLYWLPH